MRKTRTTPKPEGGRRRDVSAYIVEAILLVVVVAVIVALRPASSNVLDVKDWVLGLGSAFGVGVWLALSLRRGEISWATSRLNAFVGAFLLWAALTLVYSEYPYATLPELGRLAAHIGLYWLVIATVRDIHRARRLIGALTLAAIPVCVYAVLQATDRDPVDWATSTERVFSLLGNATYLAGFLALLIPVAVAMGWPPPRGRSDDAGGTPPLRPAWSALLLCVASAMLVCLYLTVTLSPVIGLGVGLGVGLLLAVPRLRMPTARSLTAFAAGLVAFAVLGLFAYTRLPEGQQRRVQEVLRFRDPYAGERSTMRKVGLDLFRERPLIGRGYGTFRIYALERMASTWYLDLGKTAETQLVPNYAHNEYLQVLTGTGIVGGAIFLGVITMIYLIGFRVSYRRSDPEWRRLALGIVVGLTAFLFQNLFGVTLRYTGAATVFWVLLGLLAVAGAGLSRPDASDPGKLRLREMRFGPAPPGAVAVIAIIMIALWAALASIASRNLKGGVLLKRAEFAAKQNRCDISSELADEVRKLTPYSFQAHYIYAYCRGMLGDYEGSIEGNRKALEILPANASVHYNLGVTYKKLGKLAEAEESFRRAIDLMPTAALHQGAMAEVLLERGKLDEALPYAEEAVRLLPRDPQAWLLMADLQLRRGATSEAIESFLRATKLAPDDIGIRRQAIDLLLRTKHYAEAAQQCRRWLRLDPSAVSAYNALGVSYFNLGKFKPARAAFRRAVKIDPNHAQAHLYLAFTHGKMGNQAKAQKQLRTTIERFPNSPEARSARKYLRQTRRRR